MVYVKLITSYCFKLRGINAICHPSLIFCPRRFYVLDADVEEHTFELFVIDPKAKKEPVFEIQIH
jgi:hypothetical protein